MEPVLVALIVFVVFCLLCAIIIAAVTIFSNADDNDELYEELDYAPSKGEGFWRGE